MRHLCSTFWEQWEAVWSVKKSILCRVSVRACPWEHILLCHLVPPYTAQKTGICKNSEQSHKWFSKLFERAAWDAAVSQCPWQGLLRHEVCSVLLGLVLVYGLSIHVASEPKHYTFLPTFVMVQLLSPCLAACPRQQSLNKDMLTCCTSFSPLLWMLGEFQPWVKELFLQLCNLLSRVCSFLVAGSNFLLYFFLCSVEHKSVFFSNHNYRQKAICDRHLENMQCILLSIF